MPLTQQGGLPTRKAGLQGIEGAADRFLAGYFGMKDRKKQEKKDAQDAALRVWQMAQVDPLVLESPETKRIFGKAGWPIPAKGPAERPIPIRTPEGTVLYYPSTGEFKYPPGMSEGGFTIPDSDIPQDETTAQGGGFWDRIAGMFKGKSQPQQQSPASLPTLGSVGTKEPVGGAALLSAARGGQPSQFVPPGVQANWSGMTPEQRKGAYTAPSVPSAPKTAPTAPETPVQIKDDKEYEALPSGTLFVGPDGVKRRKP